MVERFLFCPRWEKETFLRLNSAHHQQHSFIHIGLNEAAGNEQLPDKERGQGIKLYVKHPNFNISTCTKTHFLFFFFFIKLQ